MRMFWDRIKISLIGCGFSLLASKFTTSFCNIWDQYAPLVSRRVQHRRTPWMTEDILASIHHRIVTCKTFIKNRTNDNHFAYMLHRNEIKRLIHQAKRNFFIKGLRQGSKSFWRNVKQCIGIGCLKQLVNP